MPLEKGETFITNIVLSVTIHDFGQYLAVHADKSVYMDRKFYVSLEVFSALTRKYKHPNTAGEFKNSRKLYKWENINSTQV